MRRKVIYDPDLDPFRDGVALLRDSQGAVAGYLATTVEQFWTPFRPKTWQERVWWLVTWADGRRERIEEDYPPWSVVADMQQGYVDLETDSGLERRFQVEWLRGPSRDEAWQRYGILDGDVGAYM